MLLTQTINFAYASLLLIVVNRTSFPEKFEIASSHLWVSFRSVIALLHPKCPMMTSGPNWPSTLEYFLMHYLILMKFYLGLLEAFRFSVICSLCWSPDRVSSWFYWFIWGKLNLERPWDRGWRGTRSAWHLISERYNTKNGLLNTLKGIFQTGYKKTWA